MSEIIKACKALFNSYKGYCKSSEELCNVHCEMNNKHAREKMDNNK